MEHGTKRNIKLIAVILTAAMFIAGMLFVSTSASAAGGNEGLTYYYKELKNSDLATRLYKAFEKMSESPDFKGGKMTYDLLETDTLTESEVAEYVDNASPKLPVALGAARDAFYMDHPDLFYIDVYKFYLSAGMKNGRYAAYINAGTADDYYTNNTVSDANGVNSAVSSYESALSKVAEDARKAGADVIKQIEYVNAYIAENVKYDYGARREAESGSVSYDGYVNTSYGALVNKKALCGGYSRAFKAVMDRLDIPCVLIQGTACSGRSLTDPDDNKVYDSGYEAHMWNAVEVDGMWYGVDTTWNSSCGNVKKYFLVGEEFLSVDHFSDGVISSSGFELLYPALRPFDYGVNEDKNGFVFKDDGTLKDGDKDVEFGYTVFESNGEERVALMLGVSYEGKDAAQLEKEGKYLAYRFKTRDSEWYDWVGLAAFQDKNGGFGYAEGYTIESFYENTYQIQHAVFDYAPDKLYWYYDADKLSAGNTIATSAIYTNKGFGGYKPAPYVKKKTPNEYGTIKSLNPMHIQFVYSEKLVYTQENMTAADVGVSVASAHKDIEKYCKIENINWDPETNTLTFDFTPSKQFSHNCENYDFVPTNLIGETSRKVPDAAGYSFKRKQVVCSKVFNDGRLYMQVYGQPQFVGAEDMSVDGFKDKDGKPIVGDQRSQMMLVVNDASKKDADTMMDMLDKDGDIAINSEDVGRSSTYQIDFQLCGVVRKVPDRSYVQVGFGFPEGYDNLNKDVTYTVYHYKLDDKGVIIGVEEVPCIITEYGIIATVNSFSPFMVCEVPKAKVEAKKKIYASVDSAGGGTINKTAVQTFGPDGISYTATPDAGYKVDRIILNGENIYTDDTVCTVTPDGSVAVTLKENDARITEDNVMEVTFISKRVEQYYAENNIEVVRHKLVVTEKDMIAAVPHKISMPNVKKSNTAAIVVTVIVVIVAAAAAVCLTLYFINKKKDDNGNKPAAKSSAEKRPQSPSPRPMTSRTLNTATAVSGGGAARASGTSGQSRQNAQSARAAVSPASRSATVRPTARPDGTTAQSRTVASTRTASSSRAPASSTKSAAQTPRPAAQRSDAKQPVNRRTDKK